MRVLVIHNFYRSENASGENLSVRDEIVAVPEDKLDRPNVDVYLASNKVSGALPRLRALKSRLAALPEFDATLVDITCDSDGKIDSFIDLRDVKHVLELHPKDVRELSKHFEGDVQARITELEAAVADHTLTTPTEETE